MDSGTGGRGGGNECAGLEVFGGGGMAPDRWLLLIKILEVREQDLLVELGYVLS